MFPTCTTGKPRHHISMGREIRDLGKGGEAPFIGNLLPNIKGGCGRVRLGIARPRLRAPHAKGTYVTFNQNVKDL